MVLEENLLNYGMAGIFILYLIYDKTILMKEVIENIKTNTTVTVSLKERIEQLCIENKGGK